jgi:NTP pyrophosphatase (non-canonical NTP hydrolase)
MSKEYQDFVEAIASSHSKANLQSRLGTIGLGAAGEGGEIADLIKKVLYHKGGIFEDSDREKLVKELGDVLWYVAFACNTLNTTLEELMWENMEKLKERYPTGEFREEDFRRKEGDGT